MARQEFTPKIPIMCACHDDATIDMGDFNAHIVESIIEWNLFLLVMFSNMINNQIVLCLFEWIKYFELIGPIIIES